MIKITGKAGRIRTSGYYIFNGVQGEDFSWEFISSVESGNDGKQLETQIRLNIIGLKLGSDFGVRFYIHDWNNGSVDYSSENWKPAKVNIIDESVTPESNKPDTQASRAELALIEIEDMAQLSILEEKYKIDIIESYDSFVLVNITLDQQLLLGQDDFAGKINTLQNRTMISMASYEFDSRLGPPKLPQELSLDSYAPGTTGAYIIQFIGPIKQAWLRKIEDLGVEIYNYLPNYAYIVLMNSSLEKMVRELDSVQWLGIFQPAYKICPQVSGGKINIVIQNTTTLEETLENITSITPILSTTYDSCFDQYYATVDANTEMLEDIAHNPNVLWLESYDEPKLMGETSSEIVGGFWVADTPWDGPGTFTNSLGWNGTNVTVSIADTGIGNGTVGNASHPDFENRVINGTQYGTLTSWVDGHSHGTHVAGIVAGDGYEGTGTTYPTSTTSNKYYVGLGVAPDVKLVAQRIFNSAGTFQGPSSWDSFFQDAYDMGAYVHQNSWGEGTGDSAYETYDREYDQAVRDCATSTTGDQPLVICVSAGNSGSNSGTIESPASGKNVITVGASENYHPDAALYGKIGSVSADNIDDIASFSSRGLEDDGRIKPDLMAPGTSVLSANSTSGSNTLHGIYRIDNRYLWCSGTSQAAPHVSGGVACVVEWWQANHNDTKPSPALVKAALINTAQDMGTANIPNGNEGWGRMYLPDLFSPPADMDFWDQDTLLQTGNTSTYDCYVATSDYPLKITLVWTDPAASIASPTLVNNLDLNVTAPDNTTFYFGNVFSGGVSTPGSANANSNWDTDSDGYDERNNVECVFIPVKDVQPGKYKIKIIADNVATDAISNTSDTDQDYALVISGDLSVPNDVGVDILEVPGSQLYNCC
jgi:hypothetical protein